MHGPNVRYTEYSRIYSAGNQDYILDMFKNNNNVKIRLVYLDKLCWLKQNLVEQEHQ